MDGLAVARVEERVVAPQPQHGGGAHLDADRRVDPGSRGPRGRARKPMGLAVRADRTRAYETSR